ncbi:hypothetical protein MNEG_8143, partial [Monoraphidium neglectum]
MSGLWVETTLLLCCMMASFAAAEKVLVGGPTIATADRPSLRPPEPHRRLSAAAAGADDAAGAAQQYRDVLQLHNAYRARHRAAPLTWSDAAAASAQAYARRCRWQHSYISGYGENLYASSSAAVAAGLRAAVDAWFAEVSIYDFRRPGFDPRTGHFTQARGTR